nr:protein 118 [synthetic construct]
MSSIGGSGIVTGTTVSPGSTNLVQIDHGGEAMYWIVFGVFSLSALAIAVLTYRKAPALRSHGYCTLAILCTASIAYFSMATQGGYAFIKVYDETNTARAIYWARYVDWTITTPLLLLDILLMAGLSIGDTLWIVAADLAMILTGLFGALLPNRYKWGWFGIGCLFMVFIMWGLLFHGRRAAFLRSKKIGGVYSILSLYLLALWWIYPIAWGLAEGSNTISSKAEAIFYGCLDLMTKGVFGWMIMLMAEPVVARQHREEEELNGAHPSLLAAPINAPLKGVWAANGG